MWPPIGVQSIIEMVGNGPINDVLLHGAGASGRRARAMIKARVGEFSLNESICKWSAWLEREEPSEVVMGDMV